MGENGCLAEGTLEILASYSVDLNEILHAFAETCRNPTGQRIKPLKKIKLSKEKGYRLYSAQGLREKGVMALVDIANSGHLSDLESLSISGEVLSREGVMLLPKLFETGQLINLQSLTLSDYRAGPDRSDDGSSLALAIAKAINSGMLKNLNTLDLSRNDFGDECIKGLAGALKSGHLRSLEVVLLAQNDFGAKGFVALAHALRSGHMSNLKTVYLHGASTLEDEGIMEIACTLAEGSLPVLKVLSLFDGDHYRVHQYSVSSASMERLSMAYNRNSYLTAFLWDPHNCQWVNSSSKLKALQKLRERNELRVETLKTLQDEDEVAGTHGKVFLCGNPRVGKTTLRRTLMSNWTDVFRNKEEESTRGIEVAHLKDKRSSSTSSPIQLALWDLAGQHEYQVLHSAFLPDLALGDGQAIFFVIVCKASEEDDHSSQEKQLLYWLRFISSNSTKDIPEHLRRRVLVLVNCFDNKKSCYNREAWTRSLADCRKEFGNFLNICPDLFVLSAQKWLKVRDLKKRLIHDAQDILKKSLMPKVCLNVQDVCRTWAAYNKGYPVLKWQSYLNMMGRVVLDKTIEAATLYLHQAGHVILFKEGWESADSQGVGQEALVIMDPEWFCHKVVGHVLLPEEMVRYGETTLRSLMEDDGSIPLTTLQTADLTVPEEKREELVKILLRLGLCYQLEGEVARKKIFIPALMKDGSPTWCYELSSANAMPGGRSWVMGYSLVLKGSSWMTTLLPVALFRKLQVDLAQDEDMGRRSDSCYIARGSHITFKCRGMDVLVEYFSDPKDSEKERVDILVKPLVDTSDEWDDDGIPETEVQVNLAHEIVNKMLDIARECCPGVELERRIIRPWSISSDGYVPMMDRDIKMKVEAVIARMEKHGPQKTNWQVGNMLVREEDLLSKEDLRTLYDLIEKRSSRIKVAMDKIVIPEASDKGSGSSEANDKRDSSSPGQQVEIDPQTALILKEIEGLGKKMELMSTEMKGGLRRIFEQQKALVCQVQSLENFSVGLQEKSWPRFAYLAKPGDPHSWMRVKAPFRESFKLHFLCEAPFGRHTLHEVKGQVGVDVKRLKDWARRLAPILDWTLKIAFVAANVASTAILPGLGVFLPSMPQDPIASEIQITQNVISNLTYYSSEAFSSALKHQTVLDSQATSLQEGGESEGGVPASPLMHQKLKGAARDAASELLQGLNSQEFKKQVGLRRVKLDRYGTSHVVWICHDCFAKYGHAVEI